MKKLNAPPVSRYNSALVSLAGSHVEAINSKGVVGVSGRTIDEDDIVRALDAAQAVTIPHNREVIHVIQRGFTVDGQDGIRMPIGMHGYRLEVEAHIITASAASVDNLRQAVLSAGVTYDPVRTQSFSFSRSCSHRYRAGNGRRGL